MTKWITLRARFPEEELEEIDRIQKKYKLSYNEIIRSGVKFYIGVTLAKEILASTTYGKKIKILNKDLSEILTNPRYQANLEEKIIKLASHFRNPPATSSVTGHQTVLMSAMKLFSQRL